MSLHTYIETRLPACRCREAWPSLGPLRREQPVNVSHSARDYSPPAAACACRSDSCLSGPALHSPCPVSACTAGSAHSCGQGVGKLDVFGEACWVSEPVYNDASGLWHVHCEALLGHDTLQRERMHSMLHAGTSCIHDITDHFDISQLKAAFTAAALAAGTASAAQSVNSAPFHHVHAGAPESAGVGLA